MSTVDFLTRFRQLGIQLWLEDDRLRYRAPKDTLTPELRADLADRKAEIMEFLRQAQTDDDAAAPRIERVPRDGDLPLSFAQQRLWFLDQMTPGNPFYNIPAAIPLHGQIDVAALEQTLNEIVRRHETFRTTFHQVNGQPVQRIAPALHLALPLSDLRGLPDERRQTDTVRLATEEAHHPFELARGPLVRAGLIQPDDAGYVLLLTMHHIVSDGWSMGVFFPRAGGALRGVCGAGSRPRCPSCRSSTPTLRCGSAAGCRARCWTRSLPTGSSSSPIYRRWSCQPIVPAPGGSELSWGMPQGFASRRRSSRALRSAQPARGW